MLVNTVPHVNYTEVFGQAYQTYSQVIFGIALRIAGDKKLAEQILSDVFICLSRQGQFARGKITRPRHIFEATFKCVRIALCRKLGENEIQERILNVQKVMNASTQECELVVK